ncbi:hypothetical protein [Streptomyces sp. NPDC057966]|uniref:phosphotransferase-like protein n=1 Tax=Streptomyces sp. NPDC057966 TaxID=3346292 RepID=UPI0036EED1FE
MLAAACASVAESALKGCNVVVDEMLLDPDVLEKREAARGNPAGLVRGHLRTVHAHEARYDFEVDTSEVPAKGWRARFFGLTGPDAGGDGLGRLLSGDAAGVLCQVAAADVDLGGVGRAEPSRGHRGRA